MPLLGRHHLLLLVLTGCGCRQGLTVLRTADASSLAGPDLLGFADASPDHATATADGAPDTPWKTDAAVPDGIIIQADQAAPDVPADQSRRDVIGDTARDVAPEVNLLGKDAGQSEAGNANMAEAGALVPPRITPACVAPLPTGFCLAGDSGDYIAAGTNIAVPGDTAVALYRSNSTHVRFTLSAKMVRGVRGEPRRATRPDRWYNAPGWLYESPLAA